MIHAESFPLKWRLLKTGPANGAWNMAVDEAVLEAVGCHLVPPTLRLYAWDPPCLSLGYAQNIADVDLQRLQALSWDIVRRPTGGKAILHTDELTYSVIGSYEESLLKGSLLDSYRSIARCLLAALKELGIDASMDPGDNHKTAPITKEQDPICFESPSKFEITVNRKKLLGSAQARRKEAILQHGTLPLVGDLTRITKVLNYTTEDDRISAADNMRMRATTVAEVLNQQLNWETAAHAFTMAFEEHLGLKLTQSDLTPQENEHAATLIKEKYAHQRWTYREW